MKRATTLCLMLTLLLCSCSPVTPATRDEATTTTTASQTVSSSPSAAWEDIDHQTDVSADAVTLTLQDGTAADNVVTITKAGTYVVRGALSDGQLRVDCADKGTVHLVFDGVSIHSETTAPLFIKKGGKVVLTLADGSQNTLSDSNNYVFEDVENEEPSATLFSKADLTINGTGSLAVTATFRDGIVSRDGLKITDGNVSVTAADDALMGRDYVLIDGGQLTLNAEGDGIKSTNDNDDTVGFVTVEGGNLTITSAKDGIQAKSALTIQGGEVTVTAGGGSQNGAANTDYDFGWGHQSKDSTAAGKGLKAGTALTIAGGTLNIDAADDAVHSNQSIVMNGGTVTAAAGDDGFHADDSLTMAGGTIKLTKSYEGFEAKTITVEGGDMVLTASDDGVNASSGNSETSGDRGMNHNMFASDGSMVYIRGGKMYIDAKGDGLDSNGDVEMSGGEVYVIGPSGNGNGTFDYNGSFNITGGKLVGIGSSGMATAPTSNTMNSILWSGFTMYDADDLIVTASDGTVLVTLEALRSASWAYVSCAELVTGDDVTVTCGTQSKTFTITEGGNTEGNVGGMHGGMPGGMGDRPGRPGNPNW